jgi:lipopolysaccharide transport system ATP-binding protein
MSDIAMRASDLAKRYVIGAAPVDTFRDRLALGVRSLFRRRGADPEPETTFWALKDVSFEIKKGEVVGIIGRNGAGKSTLLKILSRITEPTRGRAEIYGRVGSLLEVGTGFHAELTGRENIYLNGAILGMKKAEIDRKFDDIVDFSGVGKFIDTPAKHYSSGMYVRLAFAVAAHLEPEILIVDEVLAVGDAAFQQKCLGKMGKVAKEGRTVILVSHNMAAIQGLCSQCFLLNAGELAASGPPATLVTQYLASALQPTASSALTQRSDRRGTGQIRFTDVSLCDAAGQPIDFAISGQDISLVISYEAPEVDTLFSGLDVHVSFYTTLDQFMFTCSSDGSGHELKVLPGKGQVVCHIPGLPLGPGRYVFNLYSTLRGVIADWVTEAGSLNVAAGDYFGTGRMVTHKDGFLVKHRWTDGATDVPAAGTSAGSTSAGTALPGE